MPCLVESRNQAYSTVEMSETIHFEGIPGAGKSTAAERMSGLLQAEDIDARWWLEEASDHPVMPRERRALSAQENFPEICLESWRTFLRDQPCKVAVLDGYAFQTTVRFMFERLASRARIDGYFRRWQEISPDTFIAYLHVDSPGTHFELLMQERGADWTRKLVAWVERTPVGRTHGLHGEAGFVVFWKMYQDLCVDLLGTASVPVEVIEAKCWDDQYLAGLATKTGLLP